FSRLRFHRLGWRCRHQRPLMLLSRNRQTSLEGPRRPTVPSIALLVHLTVLWHEPQEFRTSAQGMHIWDRTPLSAALCQSRAPSPLAEFPRASPLLASWPPRGRVGAGQGPAQVSLPGPRKLVWLRPETRWAVLQRKTRLRR